MIISDCGNMVMVIVSNVNMDCVVNASAVKLVIVTNKIERLARISDEVSVKNVTDSVTEQT